MSIFILTKENRPGDSIVDDANQMPLEDRLAPRHTKPGALDLTAASLFVGRRHMHAQLVDLVEQRTWEDGDDGW